MRRHGQRRHIYPSEERALTFFESAASTRRRTPGASTDNPCVIVRIKGTKGNEALEILSESGFQVHAFDDFQEVATRAIELARGSLESK